VKNQYFGDVNDYRKYGLLRAFQAAGSSRLLVNWMMTPNDDGRDGAKRRYLDEPGRWSLYDDELYKRMRELLARAKEPSVALIEDSGLLPRTEYSGSIVPDGISERLEWGDESRRRGAAKDLVFFDPDNGIEVPSKPLGRKGSSKYVAWQELVDTWQSGASLLVYQHFRREPRGGFALRMANELQTKTGAASVEAFRTPHVLFLLASQHRHVRQHHEVAQRIAAAWGTQLEPMRLANKSVQPTRSARG
jgi:hypothetical protein